MNEAEQTLGWINYWKPKDEWYYLPRQRREQLLREWEGVRISVIGQGARRLGVYECRASSSWARVSLWEFPNLEVLTGMVDALSDAGYYQFFAEDNAFGRRTEDPYRNYTVAADLTESFGGE